MIIVIFVLLFRLLLYFWRYLSYLNHLISLVMGNVDIHSSVFRDFLLKPELLRAIADSGYENPTEGKVSTIVVLFVLKLNGFLCLL